MPTGVPITTARMVRIRLPMIGLSSPPSEPGGGVISVKTASDRPANPCQNNSPRITTSQPSPSRLPATASLIITALRRRRPAYRPLLAPPFMASLLMASLLMASPDPAFDAQQHVTRRREHDEGDDEQDQPQRAQRRGAEVPDRLGEFVGDGCRNGGARRQDRGRDLVRVADDEGHRHGLAERPAEPEHDAADDADPRIGQHDVAHDLPRGAA